MHIWKFFVATVSVAEFPLCGIMLNLGHYGEEKWQLQAIEGSLATTATIGNNHKKRQLKMWLKFNCLLSLLVLIVGKIDRQPFEKFTIPELFHSILLIVSEMLYSNQLQLRQLKRFKKDLML